MARVRNSGFTLIELLVVISIIALLVSILLPALARARESANAVACMSNLRQTGIASISYANDFKGWFPPTSNFNRTFGTTVGGATLPSLSALLVSIPGEKVRYPYLSTPDVLYCPSGKAYPNRERGKMAKIGSSNYIGYMWMYSPHKEHTSNNLVLGSPAGTGKPNSQLTDPGSRVLAVDWGHLWHAAYWEANGWYPAHDVQNALFIGGHVKGFAWEMVNRQTTGASNLLDLMDREG